MAQALGFELNPKACGTEGEDDCAAPLPARRA